ncbi:hypothetical protein FKW77_006083 [Venturia effusa]|uniref:Uncharacterized protein n=1 Tax=Venturia effusa TaxID=50376 RepID=A0A517KWI9_9PEZI|nr:hypothetical protein FKW77_006083 [Venturia effusa]
MQPEVHQHQLSSSALFGTGALGPFPHPTISPSAILLFPSASGLDSLQSVLRSSAASSTSDFKLGIGFLWEGKSSEFTQNAIRQQYAVPTPSLANSSRRSADEFADNHIVYAPSSSLENLESTPTSLQISDPPAYSSIPPPAYEPSPPVYEPTALGLDDPALWSNAEPPPTATGSFHPRAAVILGLNNHWHKWLYFCRLLSVFPELKFGIPILWTLLWFVLGDQELRASFEARGNLIVVFMEVFLAAIWCAVSGYLSFFSMDCLMMRWLLIYSPIASIIRLITASFIYYVGTNFILQYSGSNLNPILLLPAWILIASFLAIIYMSMHNRTTIKRQGDNSMDWDESGASSVKFKDIMNHRDIGCSTIVAGLDPLYFRDLPRCIEKKKASAPYYVPIRKSMARRGPFLKSCPPTKQLNATPSRW